MNNKIFIYFFAVFFCMASYLRAEPVNKTQTNEVKVKKMQTSVVSPELSKEVKQNKAKVGEVNVKYEKVNEDVEKIKLQIEGLDKKIKDVTLNINKIEESSIEIKSIVEEVEKYKKKFDILSGDYNKNREKSEQYIKDFYEMKESLKERVDKMQGWDDILSVLKKELNNNEMETAHLRKKINDLKRQYGDDDNVFNIIAKWPYTGIAALAVSVVAFTIVVTK